MDDNGSRPPRPVRTALAIMRVHMLASIALLGLAVLLENPGASSTNNYYHVLLNIPRETFPALCFVSVGVGALSLWVYRRDTFAMAMAMAVAGLPFLVYTLTATYYVYGVLEGRTLVTGAVYWGAAGMYYISLLLQSAIGLWAEQLALEKRRRTDGH